MAGAGFYAITHRKRNPRMRPLSDRFGFTASEDPDDVEGMVCTVKVGDVSARHARRPEVLQY